MKNIFVIGLLASCVSCGIVLKNPKRIFKEVKVEVSKHFDPRFGTVKKNFLVLVFFDEDSVLYNSPLTKTLKIDSVKKDVSVYRMLAENYVVFKLYKKEFDSLLIKNNSFEENYKAFNPSKSFMFISVRSDSVGLYGARTLDRPKEEIQDLIWVGFGP